MFSNICIPKFYAVIGGLAGYVCRLSKSSILQCPEFSALVKGKSPYKNTLYLSLPFPPPPPKECGSSGNLRSLNRT